VRCCWARGVARAALLRAAAAGALSRMSQASQAARDDAGSPRPHPKVSLNKRPRCSLVSDQVDYDDLFVVARFL
jgi:hypothetical protein